MSANILKTGVGTKKEKNYKMTSSDKKRAQAQFVKQLQNGSGDDQHVKYQHQHKHQHQHHTFHSHFQLQQHTAYSQHLSLSA